MEHFLFATISKPALVPTQPSVQWILGYEADHSTLCSVKVKNVWSHTSTPSIHHMLNYARGTSSWYGAYVSTGTTLLTCTIHQPNKF